MWAAAIPGGSPALQSFSSFQSIRVPCPSASFLALARKLVFLCPYLTRLRPASIPTRTNFVGVVSLTYVAPLPTHLLAASPTLTATSLHNSAIPFLFALSGIIFLVASYYIVSRSCTTGNYTHHKEPAPAQTRTAPSQTYVFAIGLIIGIPIGLSIDSVPIPVILSAFTRNVIDLAADAVVHYSEKLRFSWWEAEVCNIQSRLPWFTKIFVGRYSKTLSISKLILEELVRGLSMVSINCWHFRATLSV
jgi:hypothetical protein